MQFRIRIPTRSTNITLEARSSGTDWKEALSNVLRELNRSLDILDRMQAHERDDGRIIVEDPETLRIFELRPVHDENVVQAKPVPEPEPEPEPEPAETFPIKESQSKSTDEQPSVILNIETDQQVLQAEPLPIVVIPPDQIPGTAPELPKSELPEPPQGKSKSRFGKDEEDQDQIATHLDLPQTSQTPVPSTERESSQRETMPEQPIAKQQKAAESTEFPDLLQGRSLAMVAGTFLRTIRDHIDADAGVILTPDGRQRHVIIAAAFGLPVSFKARRFKFGDGVGGFACEFDSALHIDDLDQRPDLSGELEEAIKDISSVVASPVRTRSKTHGAVELIRTNGEKFSAEEYALLQEICEAQAKKIR